MITLVQAASGGANYTGTSPNFPNGVALSISSSASAGGGAKVVIFELVASTSGSGATFPGGAGDIAFVPFGVTANPANVSAMTGTATYTRPGGATIGVIHDNSGLTKATGDVTMTANFGAGSVSGSISNLTDAGSTAGHGVSGGGTITLTPGNITGNTFNNGLQFDGSALNISGLTSGHAEGMFYGGESGNNSGKGNLVIGGTLQGTGTSQITGGTATLFGGFAAQ